MANRPRARLRLSDGVSASGSGSVVIAVCAPVAGITDIDVTQLGSTDEILDRHGYSQGASYCAMHYGEPSLPVLFCAMPIATAGSITHIDREGVEGTSIVTVTAGADGVLEQVDGSFTVTRGGTVATDQIEGELSLDGGQSVQTVRFGTATSYAIPYVGITLGLGAGTLEEDDVITFKSRAPKSDASGATALRLALAAQGVQVRTWLMIGDVDTEAHCDAIRAAAEAYAATNDRFIRTRVQVRDEYRDAALVGFRGRSRPAATTFAEVGGTGDTITRALGSWIGEGATNGDTAVVTGAVVTSGVNNVTGAISALSATVITFGSTDLAPEGPISTAVVNFYSTLTFAASGDTITRSSGSWPADGFRVGMKVAIDGTASNDGEDYIVEAVTTTVLTLQVLADEVIGAQLVEITAAENQVDWREDIKAEFEAFSGDASRRLSLGAGYGVKSCPITGWSFRRPVSWAASLREYGHDVHIPTWQVAEGALAGWSLEDAERKVVEYDDREAGDVLTNANFTCFTTLNNEVGAYIAIDLTRANPGSLLSRSHNMDVANVVCTTVQRATQREIGQILQLERAQGGQPASGRATEESIAKLETRINKAIELNVLREIVPGEGPRASACSWKASRNDILNVPGATVTGVATLECNGTIEDLDTVVKVPTFGS